jgi:hypothetical protein
LPCRVTPFPFPDSAMFVPEPQPVSVIIATPSKAVTPLHISPRVERKRCKPFGLKTNRQTNIEESFHDNKSGPDGFRSYLVQRSS